jgi:hypothetical protein
MRYGAGTLFFRRISTAQTLAADAFFDRAVRVIALQGNNALDLAVLVNRMRLAVRNPPRRAMRAPCR